MDYALAETMCGPVQPKMVTSQTGGLVGTVIGTIVLITLIGAAIYLARRKKRTLGVFGG